MGPRGSPQKGPKSFRKPLLVRKYVAGSGHQPYMAQDKGRWCSHGRKGAFNDRCPPTLNSVELRRKIFVELSRANYRRYFPAFPYAPMQVMLQGVHAGQGYVGIGFEVMAGVKPG